MIDLESEDLILLSDLPSILATHPHASTVRRWVYEGVGGAKLEPVRIGGRRATSRQSIARFLARLNEKQGPATD